MNEAFQFGATVHRKSSFRTEIVSFCRITGEIISRLFLVFPDDMHMMPIF